jgi:drug/metabolite transporter (DMT)-like permease
MPVNIKSGSRSRAWLILIALVLTWGSSFILMKRGLEVFSYQELGALRTSIAFLVLMPIFLPRLRRIGMRYLLILLVSGICGSAAPAFLFSKAQTGIDSSLAGILNSLTPLFTLLLGLFISHYRPRWYNVLGLMIAFSGTVGLLHVSGGKGFSFNLSYAVYIIAATMLYALNINIIKHFLKDLDPLTITSGSFFTLGLPMLIYLFAFTPFTETMSLDPSAWEAFGYVAILAIVATALALIAFNHLIQISNILFASSVTYLIPLMALMWGVLDGEPFRPVFLLWIALILGGVLLVNRERTGR